MTPTPLADALMAVDRLVVSTGLRVLLGGAGPHPGVGATIGVLHFSAAAVWFGGLVLLATCA